MTASPASSPDQWLGPLFLLIAVGPFVFLAIIVFIFVKVFSSGSRTPIDTIGDGPVRLHGHLTPGGSGLTGQFDEKAYGSVLLDSTTLFWEPNEGERWSTPISNITVLGASGLLSMSSPHVDLVIGGSGEWRLVVSDRRINRFMGNDAKRFREARRAKEFSQRLISSGAQQNMP